MTMPDDDTPRNEVERDFMKIVQDARRTGADDVDLEWSVEPMADTQSARDDGRE